MKRLTLFTFPVLLLLLYPTSLWAAPTIVQQRAEQVSGNVSSDSYSFASLPTIGNYIFAFASGFAAGGANVSGCSDNQGHTYHLGQKISAGTTVNVIIASTQVATSAGTFTVTCSAPSGLIFDWIIMEWSGISPSAFDKTGNSDCISGSTCTITAGSANAQANEIVFSIQIQGNASPSGYTNITTLGTISASIDYRIVSSIETSTVTYAGTFTAGAGLLETYKIDSVSGGSGTCLLSLGVGGC